MPDKRDLDQPDLPEDTRLDEDDEIVGIGEDDDEFDEEEEDVEDETLDEEPRGMRPTDEVGSEGGSEGDAVARFRPRAGRAGGAEATETWQPADGGPRTVERRGASGVPPRRSPS